MPHVKIAEVAEEADTLFIWTMVEGFTGSGTLKKVQLNDFYAIAHLLS